MHIMPCAAPCEWAQEGLRLNQTWKCISGLWRLSTMCTWLVKTLHNMFFFFCTSSCSFLAFLTFFVHWLPWFHFLNVANHRLHSALNCTKHIRVLHCQEAPFFPALNLHRQCTWRMSFWACTWVQTVSAVQIDICDHDRHIRMYTFAGLRSLQAQAISRIDPLNSVSNYF